jgi:hypothetical protein
VIADKCLELVEKEDAKADVGNPVVLSARAKAAKGMVELVRGNLELGISSPWFFFLLVIVAVFVNY